MNVIAPPPFDLVAVDDRGPSYLRLRLKQLTWSTVTVAATAYLCTFGYVTGIFAVAVAKHVLVAILIMGIGLDKSRGG